MDSSITEKLNTNLPLSPQINRRPRLGCLYKRVPLKAKEADHSDVVFNSCKSRRKGQPQAPLWPFVHTGQIQVL